MVGPGRGSAAGSIVAYSLEITDIDPIRYQLLFERFLNPERVSMPDIDVDFCFRTASGGYRLCRAEIRKRPGRADCYLRYAGGKGCHPRRGACAWICRMHFVDAIAKMIPKELEYHAGQGAESQSGSARSCMMTDDQVKYLIDMSKRLEGLPRHTSMHAAGVVISQNGGG